jgi:cytoskeleton protein RodZ
LQPEAAVHEVSGTLQAARERAGLTLEEMSARTKIKVAFLQAIERGDFEQLPGRFFARAFLRTFAREVHLPPDEVLAAYDARFAPVDPMGPVQKPPGMSYADQIGDERRPFWPPSPGGIWPTIGLAAAVILVVAVMTRTKGSPEEDARPVGTSGTGTAPAAAVAPARATVPEKLMIEIRPSRVLWVAGMADGKRAIYRLIEPGEVVRVEAHDDLWFRVGDAGAFIYSVNGSTEKPLGAPGEVREFRITHDNYRTFGR